jgi:hypothetical protein
MDINMNATPAIAAATPDSPVGVAVLKKALDSESASALALINALPQPAAAANLPPNLGQNVNTVA